MTSRAPRTSELLVHFCVDGEGYLVRRDRQRVIFLGRCDVCAGSGLNCQVCDAEHAEASTPMGGPICPECLEAMQ